MKKFLKRWWENRILIGALVLFFCALFLLSFNANKPFFGEHDWNGVRNGNIARNYLRYPVWQTKLGEVENSGQATPGQFQYFTHYPPILTLLIASSYFLWGISEYSTRLVPILASCITIVLIFLLGNKLYSLLVGFLSAVLSLATPLVLYFGKNPVQEPLVVMFVTLSFFSYICYLESKRNYFWFIFIGSLILAQLTTWTGFFLIPALIIAAVLKKEFQEAKNLIPLLILSFAVFLSYLIFVMFLTGSFFGGDLIGAFLERSGIGKPGYIENLNLFTYLNRLRIWVFDLYTMTLSFLVLVWLIDKKFHKITSSDWRVLSLAIFGLTYFAFFWNSAYIHNYLIFYLLPFMGLAAGACLDRLANLKQFKQFSLFFCLLVVALVVTEKIKLLQALSQPSADRFAVQVAKEINLRTNPKDIILIIPARFGDSADNFLKFYSDRKIIYQQNGAIHADYKAFIDSQSQSFYLERE